MAKKDTTDTSEPTEEVALQEQIYAFPQMGVVVSASSVEEANEKLPTNLQ